MKKVHFAAPATSSATYRPKHELIAPGTPVHYTGVYFILPLVSSVAALVSRVESGPADIKYLNDGRYGGGARLGAQFGCH